MSSFLAMRPYSELEQVARDGRFDLSIVSLEKAD
jgi:hypothetical protein